MAKTEYAIAVQKWNNDTHKNEIVDNILVSKEEFYSYLEIKTQVDNETYGVKVKCLTDTDGSKLFYIEE